MAIEAGVRRIVVGVDGSRATPATTTAHRRTIWIFTKILASRLLVGQDGQMIHYAQIPNNGTITTGSRQVRRSAQSTSRLSSGDLLPV